VQDPVISRYRLEAYATLLAVLWPVAVQMQMPSSSDQFARTRFCKEIDKNFSVIASAGAGKTRAVVDRIVTIALAGRDELLPRLVVVTYTNNAAREFKRRIRSTLLEKLRHDKARAILQRLEQTFFGTIHSFCMRLLWEHQADLRLPDQLTTPSVQLRDQMWKQYVSNPEFSRRFAQDRLVKEVLRFCTWQDILDLASRVSRPKHHWPSLSPPPIPDLTPVRNCVVVAKSLPYKEKLLKDLERFLASMSAGESSLEIPTTDSQAQGLSGALQTALGPLIVWLEEASLAVSSAVAAEFQEDFFRHGFLTFDDQIALCRGLLMNPEILDRLRKREYNVILDEAQDTGESMFEILIELTRPVGVVPGSWPGDGFGPCAGRFCMVGDPRQTIYDRAALGFYYSLNEAFRNGDSGDLLAFQCTKRCAAAVVETVNRTFRDSEITENEIRYDDLLAEPSTGEGYVGRLQVPTLDLENKPAEQIFTEECRILSEWIREKGKVSLGIQSWDQVAIIAPRHDWLTICADQLRKRALPFRYRNRKIPWSAVPAFTWPVALLYTLANPWDRFERLGVLREIFAVADTALAIWIHDPCRFSPELKEAEKILADLASELNGSESTTLGRLVDRIIVECRLETRLKIVGVNPAELATIRRRAFAADLQGLTLSAWIEELLILLDESADIQVPAADAIELITSYSAKGLEWDIVIPVGFGRRIFSGRDSPYPYLVDQDSRQRVIWNADSPSANPNQTDDANRKALNARYRRLLYVTLTRARHTVLFSAAEYKDTIDSFREASGFDLTEIAEVETPLPSIPQTTEKRWKQIDLPIDGADFALAARRSLEVPDLIRPHALAKDDEVAESQFTEESGTYHYGRWWHLWVERFPWQATPREQEEYAQFIEPNLPFADRARRETANLLRSPEIDEIISAGEWFRLEVSFSFPPAVTQWIEGVIDLVVGTRSKEIWVIDWKTNQKLGQETDETFAADLREKYLPQLESYRSVIEQGFGKPVARLLIYSTVLARFV
jgi:ATP-dependent exoDNAse (exonuclease V) beta subunit